MESDLQWFLPSLDQKEAIGGKALVGFAGSIRPGYLQLIDGIGVAQSYM